MTRRLRRGDRLVVASHNPGKVWEINQLIAPYGFAAVAAKDLGLSEPAETETTFEGNARLKALFAAKGSGLPALADDSGIEIDALDGAPGVYTADWAGPNRDFGIAMQRVHDELQRRQAWDGENELFEGKVYGHVVWPPRGTNGFGYDPIFVADGETMTFGEMEPANKYAISHRTRAFDVFKRACLDDSGA
jgi:XTP/dITP diphosphohydrolase